MEQVTWKTTEVLSGRLSHLLVCLEDVLGGDRAHGCAQRLNHSICHLCAHGGGVGVQNTEVALVALHHQLQRAPLGVHAVDVVLHSTYASCLHLHTQIRYSQLYIARLHT